MYVRLGDLEPLAANFTYQMKAHERTRLDSYRLEMSMIDLQGGSDNKAIAGVMCGIMLQSFRWALSGTSVAVETVLVRGERVDWSDELRVSDRYFSPNPSQPLDFLFT